MIRAAEQTDIGAITDIYNEAVHDRIATCDLSDVPLGKRGEWLTGHRYPHGVWVLTDGSGGPARGWVALSRYDTKPCFHRTATFATYVRRTARGQGVGSRLRAWMIDVARERGFHTLVNRVWANNSASIALAKRFGFVEVGRMRELVDLGGEYVDCLFFQLMLHSGQPGAIEDSREPARVAR
ncbi:GNAT family N-acetyltransferase [Amycolatopsis samaneae]|uniref:N-acetyltransferase family protein n=1 Tax=Amycolatopsis samaneae TaxID=664691 RepID=A0ABW5GP88_9PSEU